MFVVNNAEQKYFLDDSIGVIELILVNIGTNWHDMRRFCGKVGKIMVNLVKIGNSMNPYLLSMQIIASFVS